MGRFEYNTRPHRIENPRKNKPNPNDAVSLAQSRPKATKQTPVPTTWKHKGWDRRRRRRKEWTKFRQWGDPKTWPKGPQCSRRRQGVQPATREPKGGHPGRRTYASKGPHMMLKDTWGDKSESGLPNYRTAGKQLKQTQNSECNAQARPRDIDRPRKQESHPKDSGRRNPAWESHTSKGRSKNHRRIPRGICRRINIPTQSP